MPDILVNEETMQKTEDIERILSVVVTSGYLKDERPLSLILISRVESGKSELLLKLRPNPSVMLLSDVSAFAMTAASHGLVQQIMSGVRHHIVIPDLLAPTGRNRDTVNTLITFLNVLIEEGAVSLHTYATKIDFKEPLRVGLITAIAKGELERHHHLWARLGFLSRLLPITYSYSPGTVAQIGGAIAGQAYHHEKSITLKVPDFPEKVILTNEVARNILTITPQVLANCKAADTLYGFRLQRQLQVMAMAHALYQGRTITNAEDYDFVVNASRYINLNYSQI